MYSEIIVKNPHVYDKKNGVNGEKKDILISNGIIVESLKDESRATIIDGNGKIAFPGAIDLKSHFFANETNFARVKALNENNLIQIPSYPEIQKQYLDAGFTFICESDVPISQSKISLTNMVRVPIIDHAMIFDLASNWLLLHDFQDKKDAKYISSTISNIMDQQKGYGVSINCPYHPQFWNLNEKIPDDPEKIPIFRLNVKEIFIEFIKSFRFNKLRAVPFISPYGMENSNNVDNHLKLLRYIFQQLGDNNQSDWNNFTHLSQSNHYFIDKTDKLIDFYTEEKKFSMDVTPLLFGSAYPLITRDRNLAMRESNTSGIPLSSVDLELDTEFYVTTRDLTKVTTDNFPLLTSWIEIILSLAKKGLLNRISLASNAPYNMSINDWVKVYSILINLKFRKDYLKQVPETILTDSVIQDNTHELDLIDIEELVCLNPSKALGVSDKKGNLGLNADADLIIFDINHEAIHNKNEQDVEKLKNGFATANIIIKNGVVIKKNGIFKPDVQKRSVGKIFWNKGKTDQVTLDSVIKSKEKFYDKYASIYLDSLKNVNIDNLTEIN